MTLQASASRCRTAPDTALTRRLSGTVPIDVNELDRRYGYCDTCSTTIYNAGTITLDFVDSHTNKLVWRGWSEGSLEGIDSQALIEQRVDDAVTRILAKLPPRM